MRLRVVVAMLAAMVAPAADACSRRFHPTDAQLFSEAEHVIVARVVSTQLRQLPRKECEADGLDEDECSYVEAKYELSDVLKGSLRGRGKVRDLVFGPGNCSLGVLAGFYYVFYIDKEHNWVPHISGSFPLGPSYGERERQAVERVRVSPHQRPAGDA
jgi:hypothetical protein